MIAHAHFWRVGGYGAALRPRPLRLQASPGRLHSVPFAAIPSTKGKGTIEKNCLDRQLRLLVDSLAERVLCATLAFFTLVTSAVPVVFVSLSLSQSRSTTKRPQPYFTSTSSRHKRSNPGRGLQTKAQRTRKARRETRTPRQAKHQPRAKKQSSSIAQYELNMASFALFPLHASLSTSIRTLPLIKHVLRITMFLPRASSVSLTATRFKQLQSTRPRSDGNSNDDVARYLCGGAHS